MRRVMHGDIVAAACRLRDTPPGKRPAVLQALMERAHAADLYRRRFGRAHPRWGDGTLAAATRQPVPRPEPPLSDTDYLWCIGLVAWGLAARGRYPRAQEMHFGAAGSNSSRAGAISSPQSTQ